MDANSSQALLPSEPLMYQTWFLKVSIHCQGCRRKVKKVLQSIDGVFTTTVDPQQQKVTVTGSVGVETLIRKLEKAGKHAEIWPENLAAGKGNNSNKDKQQQQQKKKKKKNEQGEESEGKNNQSTTTNAVATNTTANTSKKKMNEKSCGERGNGESKSSGGGENESAESENKSGESEGVGKKKKKKGMEKSESNGSSACNGGAEHSGSSGQVNLSPTRQQFNLYPETYCYPPLVYLATHNRLCPMGTMGGPSYYVSPLPYMCAGIDHDPYRLQSTPLVPFEIFSDENANGCCIM
ncbi:heavy metal-associated isoprenylated plant protein 36-like [Vigna radiata var. radiata]|uniref:Heavy metal-associated isoprenylated plant protein 36-like n=1 Tax=Vigna radiata var. radiata TaxID=3916 RepID=A0A1S3UQZ9_VIGRR|nr:heavy metal-associated isoprenylated plant protein 36-like [Vigna radiata var. radiata]